MVPDGATRGAQDMRCTLLPTLVKSGLSCDVVFNRELAIWCSQCFQAGKIFLVSGVGFLHTCSITWVLWVGVGRNCLCLSWGCQTPLRYAKLRLNLNAEFLWWHSPKVARNVFITSWKTHIAWGILLAPRHCMYHNYLDRQK